MGSKNELLRGGALRGVACVGNMVLGHERLCCIFPVTSHECACAARLRGASCSDKATDGSLITARRIETLGPTSQHTTAGRNVCFTRTEAVNAGFQRHLAFVAVTLVPVCNLQVTKSDEVTSRNIEITPTVCFSRSLLVRARPVARLRLSCKSRQMHRRVMLHKLAMAGLYLQVQGYV